MVQVLEDVDLILQANSFRFVQSQFVDHLDSALLTISLNCCLFNLTKSSLADYIAVEVILLHEDIHILVLDNEVFLPGLNFIFIS